MKILTKTWWRKHWDEVAFVISIIASIYYILRGTGYIT